MESPRCPAQPLSRLFYRYWFFGWMFLDAGRGSWLEREAALRHNRNRAHWLPLYIRRWLLLGTTFYALGVLLESVGINALAAVAFIHACIAMPILAVATAGWLLLRGPRKRDY